MRLSSFRTLVKSLYANARRRPLRLLLLTDSASLRTAANVLTYEKIPFYHNGRLVTPPVVMRLDRFLTGKTLFLVNSPVNHR